MSKPTLFLNPQVAQFRLLSNYASLLGRTAPQSVREYLSLCPRHAVTPLHSLNGLATILDVAGIFAKDEGQRLGLGSFKALGGAYAVARLVQRWASDSLGRQVEPAELTSAAVRLAVNMRTVTCATDGNHGRSVAAGANAFGCKSVIFIHPHVSPERRDAMVAFGAELIEVAGTYDDSVSECARQADLRGWQLISDTSWPGYEEIPGMVMQGYTVMADEALSQMPEPPTHVFLQAGVGGMAAAVVAYLLDRLGLQRPCMIVVEPKAANCIKQSAQAGQLMTMPASGSTIMGMLECYRPSDLAWQILHRHADAFMDLSENSAPDIMKRLALPVHGDTPIVAGESGGAGMAALLAASTDTDIRQAIGIDSKSKVLVFITEGATAPAAYQDLVGLTPEQVVKP